MFIGTHVPKPPRAGIGRKSTQKDIGAWSPSSQKSLAYQLNCQNPYVIVLICEVIYRTLLP